MNQSMNFLPMGCRLPSNVRDLRDGMLMSWHSLQSISLKDQGQFRKQRKLSKQYCAIDNEILL
jgi:hypothetical protein